MRTLMRCVLLLGCLNLFIFSPAQFVGGHEPSQPPSGKVEASSLSAGPVSNSVDHFTGALSLSYDFGNVATLSGLSFPLRLQYSSATLTSYEPEHSSGIPYGEGWSLADASITVETAAFDFLPDELAQDTGYFADSVFLNGYSPFAAQQVGKLFYSNPRIQLPGGISGRLVYKSQHPKDQDKAVYILNGFDTYTEVWFNGQKWEAVLPDGTVYVFATPQYRHRNPTNQTAWLNQQPSAGIVPKADITRWHLNEILNPNHANGQHIIFEYEGFGETDPYQELQQISVKQMVDTIGNWPLELTVTDQIDTTTWTDTTTYNPNSPWNASNGPIGNLPCWVFLGSSQADTIIIQAGNPLDQRAKVYRDILLKSVTALDAQGGEHSRVELKYKSWRPENELNPDELENGRFLLLSDPQVQRMDSLYSKKVVWFQGQDGSIARTLFERPALDDSLVLFNADWKRYMHPAAYQNPWSAKKPVIHSQNPYIFQLNEPVPGLNQNSWLWARTHATSSQNTGEFALPFTHSVLESPRISGKDLKKLPSGDEYQLRSVIKLPDSLPFADMNFDVRIGSGASPNNPILQTIPPNHQWGWNEHTVGGRKFDVRYAAFPSSSLYFNASGYYENGYEIFSTLRNIVKWNPAYQHTPLYATTDNTFRMPNLPNEFGGFVVQIGPASDNLKHNYPTDDDKSYYHRFNNYPDTSGQGPADGFALNRTNWFGSGAPLEPLFRTDRFGVEKGGGFYGKGELGERFMFWYLDPSLTFNQNQLLGAGPNQPTAVTREALKNPLPGGNYAHNNGTMAGGHRNGMDTQLQSVELARIAKNPWMLDSVIFMTTSGAYGYDRVRTKAYKLKYEVAQVPRLNNVNRDDTLATWAYDYKLIEGDTMYRNIFRLAGIRRLGTDTLGRVRDNDPSYTFFEYLNDDRSTPELCEATMIRSTWNELGGKTDFTYNWAQADTATWNRNVLRPNNDQSYQLMGGGQVYQRLIPVATVTQEDGAGGQETAYEFHNRILLQRGVDWDPHFNSRRNTKSKADRIWGFARTVVYSPSMALNGPRARTEYHFRDQTGTFADTLLFGRMEKVEQYDDQGQITSRYEADYTATLAYSNGQRNFSSLFPFFGGNFIQAKQNEIFDYDPYYTWEGKYANYMRSFFIRKTEERTTDFDPITGRSITQRTGYTYYDWDSTRQEIGTDYLEMYRPPFGGVTWFAQEPFFDTLANEFTHHAEPSWQLASVTKTNDEIPDAYTKETYYYLYDIEPFLDRADVYSTRYIGSMRPFYLARKNGIRNTLYEKRHTEWNGDSLLKPISLSTYYEWDIFRDVPGDFVQIVDSTYYGSVCNNNDPGDFQREGNHAVVYCFGEGRPVERHRIIQEITDDPRYIESKDSLWYFFPIDSFAAMDFSTFDGLPEFHNQNPNEVCQNGGFAIGPDSKVKYFGHYYVSDGTSFYGSWIKAAERNYGKELREPPLSEYSKDRSSPLVFFPHLHGETKCHKIHGFTTLAEANAAIHDSAVSGWGLEGDGQRKNFVNMLDNEFYLRAIYQQADTVFNTYTRMDSASNPNYPSPHNLWDSIHIDPSWNNTHVNYQWRLTAPTIRTYQVHERNMHGLVVEESDVRHLHTIYEYPRGEYRYEFDSCGNARTFINRDFFGVPLSVTVTNMKEIEQVTVFDYYPSYHLRQEIAPSGEIESYRFDAMGRLVSQSLNGKPRKEYWFSKWNGNRNLSWNDRTRENHYTTIPIRDQSGVHQVQVRNWVDPLGRNIQNAIGVFAHTVWETKEYQGQVSFDKWNRPVGVERNQFEIQEGNFDYEPGLPTSSSAVSQFENSHKGRLVRSAKPGNSIWGNKVSVVDYKIINLDEFQILTGATFAEMQEVFPYLTGLPLPKLKLYQVHKTDEDGKQIYAFSDAAGRTIATLGFTDFNNASSGPALTLFCHDAVGNLTKTIHPNKVQSSSRYNVLGWMIEENSPDAGTSKYFYNQAGDVKVMQDENLRTSNRFRVFDYDHAGRLIRESTSELASSPTAFNNTGVRPLEYQTRPDLLFRSIHSIGDEFDGDMGVSNTSTVMDSMLSQEQFPRIVFPRSNARMVKAFRYDYSVDTVVSGVTEVPTGTIHPNLLPLLPVQNQTLGRVAAELVYDPSGSLIEQTLFSYDDEGRGSWMAKQFASGGITSTSLGDAHFIETERYNLQDQPGRVSIDLQADGEKDLQHVYRYDPQGRLHQLLLNKDGNDYLVAQYGYLLGTGLTGSVIYFSHASQCPDPIAVDTILYTYDHQDRMTKLRSHFFDFGLYYDGSSPGNVLHHQNWNGTTNGWKAKYKVHGQGVPFFNAATTYGFEYDHLNRLRAADASIPEQTFPRGGTGYNQNLSFGIAQVQTDPRYYGDARYDYDAAGNLSGLWRYNYFDPGPVMSLGLGDNWTYHYAPGTNRLTNLTTGGVAQTQISYDTGGNLSGDTRRGLSGFAYNEQNLPTGYRKSITDSVSYLYGSSSSRIYKEETSPTGIGKTFYLRDAAGRSLAIWDDRDSVWTFPIYGKGLIAEYRQPRPDSSSQRVAKLAPEKPKEKQKRQWLRKIRNMLLAGLAGTAISRELSTEESMPLAPVILAPVVGEISDILGQHFAAREEPKPTDSAAPVHPPLLKFFVEDHLGNVRVSHRPEVYFDSLTMSCKVRHQLVSAIDYYPYGKVLRSWHLEGPERFMTTGHERDRESGLDYRGARYYDADYGRFLSLDPLAAIYPGWSPYNYVLGNPISWVDPDGRNPETSGEDKYTVHKIADREYLVLGVSITAHKKSSYAWANRVIENFNGSEQFRYDPGWREVHGTGSGLTTVQWTWEGAEVALDAIGSTEIPILSQLADLGAATIAFSRGDNWGAGLSTLATIPILGEVANGAKWTRRVATVANVGKKLPMGVPTWKNAIVDWKHIFELHADWGKVGKQSGNKDIFKGLSESQIREVVEGAYKNINYHSKLARQNTKTILQGKYKSWDVEFIVNRKTKVIETAYPKKR